MQIIRQLALIGSLGTLLTGCVVHDHTKNDPRIVLPAELKDESSYNAGLRMDLRKAYYDGLETATTAALHAITSLMCSHPHDGKYCSYKDQFTFAEMKSNLGKDRLGQPYQLEIKYRNNNHSMYVFTIGTMSHPQTLEVRFVGLSRNSESLHFNYLSSALRDDQKQFVTLPFHGRTWDDPLEDDFLGITCDTYSFLVVRTPRCDPSPSGSGCSIIPGVFDYKEVEQKSKQLVNEYQYCFSHSEPLPPKETKLTEVQNQAITFILSNR